MKTTPSNLNNPAPDTTTGAAGAAHTGAAGAQGDVAGVEKGLQALGAEKGGVWTQRNHPLAEGRGFFSYLQMEASLCVWEAMLELREAIPALDAAWEDQGTIMMRHKAYDVANIVLAVWNQLSENEREAVAPYDFEFVPAVVRQIDWEGAGSPQVLDGCLETAKRCILAGATIETMPATA